MVGIFCFRCFANKRELVHELTKFCVAFWLPFKKNVMSDSRARSWNHKHLFLVCLNFTHTYIINFEDELYLYSTKCKSNTSKDKRIIFADNLSLIVVPPFYVTWILTVHHTTNYMMITWRWPTLTILNLQNKKVHYSYLLLHAIS